MEDLANPPPDVGAAFTAEADVNLDLALSLGEGAAFPRLLADVGLDWSFAGADPGASGPFGGRPQIAFENIQLDLGTFLSNVVGPIVNTVDSVKAGATSLRSLRCSVP